MFGQGRLIWWNDFTCLGYVCRIIDDPAELAAMELNEPHILIGGIFPKDLSSGFVAYGYSHFETEGICELTPREESDLARATLLARARSAKGFEKEDLHWVEPQWNEAHETGWTFHRVGKDPASGELVEIECIVIPPGIPPLPLNYPDGTPVQNGDLVWWNEGSCIGFVQIIPPNDEFLAPGIFIIPGYPFNADIAGVLHPTEIFEDEGIGPFSPEEQAGFDHALKVAAADSSLDPKAVLLHVSPRIDNDETRAWLAGWEVTYSQPDGSKRETFVPVPSSS